MRFIQEQSQTLATNACEQITNARDGRALAMAIIYAARIIAHAMISK